MFSKHRIILRKFHRYKFYRSFKKTRFESNIRRFHSHRFHNLTINARPKRNLVYLRWIFLHRIDIAFFDCFMDHKMRSENILSLQDTEYEGKGLLEKLGQNLKPTDYKRFLLLQDTTIGNIGDWLKHQFLTFNIANVALLIVIVIISTSIKDTLTQQQAANVQAQQVLTSLNIQLASAQNTLTTIKSQNDFFKGHGFSNFSQLIHQYENFNNSITQLTVRTTTVYTKIFLSGNGQTIYPNSGGDFAVLFDSAVYQTHPTSYYNLGGNSQYFSVPISGVYSFSGNLLFSNVFNNFQTVGGAGYVVMKKNGITLNYFFSRSDNGISGVPFEFNDRAVAGDKYTLQAGFNPVTPSTATVLLAGSSGIPGSGCFMEIVKVGS